MPCQYLELDQYLVAVSLLTKYMLYFRSTNTNTNTLNQPFYLLWSGGTGHREGNLLQQDIWQTNPHISQEAPCRVRPIINDVQWLHFVGAEKFRTQNWCMLLILEDTSPDMSNLLLCVEVGEVHPAKSWKYLKSTYILTK